MSQQSYSRLIMRGNKNGYLVVILRGTGPRKGREAGRQAGAGGGGERKK